MVHFTTCVLSALLYLQTLASPLSTTTPQHTRSTSADNRNCTASTFANTTTFTLIEYHVEAVTQDLAGNLGGGSTRYRATFSIQNTGNGDTYRLVRIPVTVGGGTWSVCRAGDGAGALPLPKQLARCQYLLEHWQGGEIGFRLDWYCDGGEGGKPLLFDATVIGQLPAETCVVLNGTDGVTQSCTLAGGVTQLPLEVANISWETESEPEATE
ncbi:hypothetical protein B0T26DRAFT_669522 [Lasiosphaeria miniovina]|uniref:AA1-like domain-containing protein n=1 Tax=Lasiosphaeria miniovina TaxID=1954250 RepID=A0AA40EAR7_9PEZI|nr:uncharacterized protein B0T26DRAFT_669522 [Lasiosphaeria miniovina]KAK0733070.1 hypothetical protein B0T26DRAFT_669522 [Lasiosphaeria miniovina]